jgi:nuclear GTP-binding protein
MPKKPAFKKGASSDNPDRFAKKGGMRDKATIKRLNMYRKGGAIRNKEGHIVGGDYLMKDRAGNTEITASTGRIQPDRRWFGNTRVIGAKQLDTFRDELAKQVNDPYAVVLRANKLPMSLLQDPKKQKRMHLLSTESFGETFGKNKQRKRPKIASTDYSALVSAASAGAEEYATRGRDINIETVTEKKIAKESVLDAGNSKRIWGELYKVLDCSDVVLQVLDARDPMGTRSIHVEKQLRKNARHKHLVFILNKCDLVPTWVTKRWVTKLSAEYPTLAFHANQQAPFGKGALISLLQQFGKLHSDKKQISVGLIGFPNVGKSSVINALKRKKVCNVAPVPGETKVWQYVTLFKRIFLIDCPGVVPPTGQTDTERVMRGAVRAERLDAPSFYVDAILKAVKRRYIIRTYGIRTWRDGAHFLEQLAAKSGKILKGGELAVDTVARTVINDLQRGKLPHFCAPPALEEGDAGAVEVGSKRKRKAQGGKEGESGGESEEEGPAKVVAPAQSFDGLQVHAMLKHAKETEEDEEGEGDGGFDELDLEDD